MANMKPLTELDTHEVFNQPPPLEGASLFGGDRALVQAVRCADGGTHDEGHAHAGKGAPQRMHRGQVEQHIAQAVGAQQDDAFRCGNVDLAGGRTARHRW